MQVASEIVEELAFHPVMSRFAGFLLDISGKTEDENIARDFTQDEIAACFGTTRERACRYLFRFAEQGAIDIIQTGFKIINRGFFRGPGDEIRHGLLCLERQESLEELFGEYLSQYN